MEMELPEEAPYHVIRLVPSSSLQNSFGDLARTQATSSLTSSKECSSTQMNKRKKDFLKKCICGKGIIHVDMMI